MTNNQRYFSFVTDRISELQEELKKLKQKKERATHFQTIQRYQLEEDFINKKITYLSRLVDLPTLLLLSNLTTEQLDELRRDGLIPVNEDGTYLIKKMGLEKLDAFVKVPKIVTLSHIKDAFIGDFHSLLALLAMNEQNLELTNHKNKLYGVGLNGEVSYLKIRYDEKQLDLDAAEVNQLVNQANNDFDLETLKEISSLIENPNQKLSAEFVLKHGKKITEHNPEMKKVIKKLTRKKRFGWISKWLPRKRNKVENKFMNAVIAYYNDNPVANTFEISTNGLFSKDGPELAKFASHIQHECQIRSNEIRARKSHINHSKKNVLKQIQEIDEEQAVLRQNFISLVQSKTNYFPKSFQEQLWKEPDLKNSCLNEACYLEEKKLIEELTNQLRFIQPTSLAMADIVVAQKESKVKQLVA